VTFSPYAGMKLGAGLGSLRCDNLLLYSLQGMISEKVGPRLAFLELEEHP
jgi:hypothetical protein